MPTVLRFRNFRVVIFTDDHHPPHVHALGSGVEFIYNLNCPAGPPALRANAKGSSPVEKHLSEFIADNLQLLCTAWEKFHGDARAV